MSPLTITRHNHTEARRQILLECRAGLLLGTLPEKYEAQFWGDNETYDTDYPTNTPENVINLLDYYVLQLDMMRSSSGGFGDVCWDINTNVVTITGEEYITMSAPIDPITR